MTAVPLSPPERGGATRDRRALRVAVVQRQPTVRTSNPPTGEQAQLAHDLAALIQAGLIVAVGDGPEIRYAAAGGEEVLP